MGYRWESPHEWLRDRTARAAGEGDGGWLPATLRVIIPALDADTIQDLFQAETDEDGYFGGEEG
jgi:hypothetical protein